MIAGLLCLFAGILAALSLPVMPSPTAGVLLLLIALSLMRLRAARPVSWALAGCALVVLEAGARLADRIPASLVDRDWRLDGEVVALLSDRPERPSFLFHPDASGRTAAIPGRIRLVWYDPPAIPSPGRSSRMVPEAATNARDWRLYQELAGQADGDVEVVECVIVLLAGDELHDIRVINL